MLAKEPDCSDCQDPEHASKRVAAPHLPGECKRRAHASAWRAMNALLFARGDTWDLLDDKREEERLPRGHALRVWATLRPQGG